MCVCNKVWDEGTIVSDTATFVVRDVQVYGDYVLHIGEVKKGELTAGQRVKLHVDYKRRALIAKNHTATPHAELLFKVLNFVVCIFFKWFFLFFNFYFLILFFFFFFFFFECMIVDIDKSLEQMQIKKDLLWILEN